MEKKRRLALQRILVNSWCFIIGVRFTLKPKLRPISTPKQKCVFLLPIEYSGGGSLIPIDLGKQLFHQIINDDNVCCVLNKEGGIYFTDNLFIFQKYTFY